jgi:7,8-dihydropterin-6-yl-methyl-4-(beta-D-ribofuranosyl)aminobenzene 5'-phosphate synthase
MGLVRNLRITTLAENLVMTRCLGQWGLALLIELIDAEGDRRKIVFDTGVHMKSLFYNIKQLKVDLSDLDCLVISHGHADHTASTVEVTEAAGGLKVYAHPHTFQPRFVEEKTGKRRRHGVPKDEGIDEIERVGGEVVLASGPLEIVPGVWTTGQIERSVSFERAVSPSKKERRVIIVNGEEVPDRILDDQAIWMHVERLGVCAITGCAHAGLLNTLHQVQRLSHVDSVYGLIGGTHLIGRPSGYLQQTVEGLHEFRLGLISPCHCTGFKAMVGLWHAFPEAFLLNFSGRVIDFQEEPREQDRVF